jgi:hypothetical protein
MRKTLYTLFLFTVLLTACGAPSETAPAGDSGSDEPTLREALEDAGVDIDPVLRDIMILEEKRAAAEFTVAYTTTMSNNGETMATSMVEYQDGTERKRTDVAIPEMGETRTYTLGERYVTCSKFGSDWNCQEFTASDDVETTEEDAEYETDTTWTDDEEVEEVTFERDGTMTVAGVTTECFKADFAGLVSKQCLSKQGVVLYMYNTDSEGGTMEMRASSYKESVSDGDFAFPAEPMEAGSAEANQASCRDSCAVLDMSGAECDEFCSQMAQYESYE